MSLNRQQIRQKLYELFGPDNLGYHSTFSARTTTTGTDRTRWGTYVGQYNQEGRGLYIPALASPNDFKRIGSIAAGVVTIADLAWSDGGSGPNLYENIRADVYPDELNAAIREAVEEIYTATERPLTLWDLPDGSGDGVFDEANTTSWIAGGGSPVIAKTTSAAYNLTGYNSLLVTNAAANNYVVHNVDVPVAPGEQLWLAANVILGQGTNVSFSIINKDTNSSTYNQVLGSTLTATGLVPYHLGQIIGIPSDCHAINCRLGAAASNSIAGWDALPGHSLSRRGLAPPSWAKQNWQITGIGPTRYEYQVSSGVWTAESRRDYNWKRGPYGDWKTSSTTANSRPGEIRILKRDIPAVDLWLRGMRPESDTAALTDEATATNADPELVMACCVLKVAAMLAGKGTVIDPKTLERYEMIAEARRSLNVEQEEEPAPSRIVVGRWG